jgi:aldehyde:ferredoxin oxidoreductase
MPHTAQTVLQAGERIINIQRAFAVKEGISRKDDIIPQRITDGWKEGESLRNPGAGPNLEVQLEEYYQLRGWDENGIPTKERLKLLGLDKVVADLYPS